MRRRPVLMKAGVALCLALLGVVGLFFMPRGAVSQLDIEPEGVNLYPVNNYGWLTLYMHEVFERYNQARTAYDKGDMELAEANLVVMDIFVDESLKRLPEKLADGKPFPKDDYVKSTDKLKEHTKIVRGMLKEKKWPAVPEGQLDPMLQTCVGCHAAYNIPIDFRIDNKLKLMTHLMHEIYDVYRVAGPLLKKKDWDQAKYCFTVLRPYIEDIPANIPEKNQDGEKLDKALFVKVYKELKQFNEDIIKKIEKKSFETGKPLPPPRLVMDNCKVCHANAKIESPW